MEEQDGSLIDWIVGTKFSVGVTNVPNLTCLVRVVAARSATPLMFLSQSFVYCAVQYFALLLLSSDLCTA